MGASVSKAGTEKAVFSGFHVNDWVGNRTSPPSGTDAMVYNDVDQLVAWPGMHGDATHPGYVYDDNGNLVEVKNAGGTSNVVTYTYGEDTNLLESATYGGHTLANTWDVFGDRSSVAVNGRTYSFTYNILAGIPAVIEEVDSGTNGKTYYYYRDPGGALIARRDASDPDSLQYYHYDELGSTRIITNKDGQVTDTYAYDAYGSVIAHVGSTTDNPYQYVGALGYYTHYQDPEFKLLQVGFRFYDPETGRFTQQDPAGDGINWYAYCGGNPMAGVDPWGLNWLGDVWDTLKAVPGELVPGVQTGLAAVGSALTLGYWDGGRWKNEPGFGTSKKLAYVGMAAGTAAGALAGAQAVIAYRAAQAAASAARVAAGVAQGSGGAGVVYKLIQDGRVVYIGRTIDFARRMAEQALVHGDIGMEKLAENLNYAEMRGIEQLYILEYGLSNLWNEINGVAASNPHFDDYIEAGKNVICPK